MIIEQLNKIYDKLYDIYDCINPGVFCDPGLGIDMENNVGDLLDDIREVINSIEEDI